MNREALESWERSGAAWAQTVNQPDEVNRRVLLDPVMLRLAGDVDGRRVLDIGCGEGRFCRMLTDRGAKTVGVDPTTVMLRAAGPGAYARAAAECLPLAAGSFDLAVSYVVLVDVEDYAHSIREAVRVLRPGGSFLVANVNPYLTTRVSPWVRDEAGRRLHVAVDDYFDPRAQRIEWAGISILNWHRPLAAYMSAFLDTGLVLRRFEEPRPSAADVERYPSLAPEYRVPLFQVMLWQKPVHQS